MAEVEFQPIKSEEILDPTKESHFLDSESNKLFDDQLSYITGVSTDEETDTNSYNNQTYYKYIDNYIRNHNGNINLHNEHFKKTNLTLLFRIPQ